MRTLNRRPLILCLAAALSASAPAFAKDSAKTIGEALRNFGPEKGAQCCTADPLPGCSSLLENFCDDLYSQKNKGNLDIRTSKGPLKARFGNMPNGFSTAFYEYARAKADSADRLPKDLKARLDQSGYFGKLAALLDGKSPAPKTLAEKIALERKVSEVGVIYNQAFEDVSLARVEKAHPGFGSNNMPPRTWIRDADQVGADLSSEVSRITWEKSPVWKKVEKDYADIKKAYLEELKAMKGIGEDVRADWIARIRSVELQVPGADSNGQEECATTEMNAFYSPATNRMVVCGGIATTTEVAAVIGHELSHALDSNRSKRLYQTKSELWGALVALRRQACDPGEVPTCPANWPGIRDSLPALASKLEAFEPQVPEYLSCLQYKPPKMGKPPAKWLGGTAVNFAKSQMSSLADSQALVVLTSKETVKPDGTKETNPYYLNPCGKSGFDESKMDLDRLEPLFFTLEYLCGSTSASPADKIRKSAEAAMQLQSYVSASTIGMGGPFSNHPAMVEVGAAENPAERFADGMGFRVVARYLKQMDSVEDRRHTYLANSAFFCDPPSLAKEHPAETQAQKEFSFEPHSTGKQRRLETLIPAIRDAIGCQKDFEGKDCSL